MAALLVCHTLMLLPAVYPTHRAYRLQADFAAAAKYCAMPAVGDSGEITTAAALTRKSCCARNKHPTGQSKQTPCPVCREFSNFILLETDVVTIPEGIEAVIVINDKILLPMPQWTLIDTAARAPPPHPVRRQT